MSTDKLIMLLGGVVGVVLFMYVILPKLKLNLNQGKALRAAIFAGIIIALAIDFIQKERYWYLVILALGSIGFGVMLYDSRRKGN